MIKVSEKVQKAIDSTLEIVDMLSEENGHRIRDLLDDMKSEKEIIEYLTTPPALYFNPGEEPKRAVLDAVVKKEQLILQERFHFPHKSVNDKGVGVLSNKKFFCVPLYIRRNQQIAMKEGKSAEDSSFRDSSGQVTSHSRSGQFSDAEIAVAIGQGAYNVQRELLGPASSDLKAKEAMKQQILTTGKVNLDTLPNDPKNKRSLMQLSHMLRAMGYDNDLVEYPK